jgi:hypothetical protein
MSPRPPLAVAFLPMVTGNKINSSSKRLQCFC